MLWLCIAACVSVLVGLGVVLAARSHFEGGWHASFVLVIALLATVLLIYSLQYFCFVYIGGTSDVLDGILFYGSIVVYSLLVVAVPVTALRARRMPVERRRILILGGAAVVVAVCSAFGHYISFAPLRRIVLSARYAVSAMAFLWAYGMSFSSGGGTVAPFFARFCLLSGVSFLVVAVDAAAIRFSLSPYEYVPDGVISLLAYGIVVGVSLPRFATRRMRSHREKAELPAEFLARYDITRREGEIIRCLLKGSTNNEIGEQLYISPRTVDTHFSNIYRKCGVRSRLELVRLITSPSAS